MKNISLFTCSVMASVVVLSACAQTTVSVRPVNDEGGKTEKSVATVQRHYEPISLNEPYIVQQGDTLYGISFRAGLSYREVATWNDIQEPYTVKVGQRILLKPVDGLIVTDVSTPAAVATITPVESRPLDTKPVDVKPVDVKPSAVIATAPVVAMPTVVPSTTKPSLPTIAPATIETPESISDSKPAVVTNIMSWRWPSDGTVIARYVQGDPTQQGINIGGKSGQAVKAASDGTVVYSGAGLVGYGELIIIKHNNEWLSAYAHNRRRLVAEGSKVRAGDVIAEMGRTGTMRDMLHFEIRRNGKPVDPLLYLPKQ
ncbi:MAG: peptidoglycan DD-metalloendopeptidase family protein [Arenimonas sp.]